MQQRHVLKTLKIPTEPQKDIFSVQGSQKKGALQKHNAPLQT